MYTESPSPFELVGLKIFLSFDNLQIFFFQKIMTVKKFPNLTAITRTQLPKMTPYNLRLSLSFMFKFISKFSIHEPT